MVNNNVGKQWHNHVNTCTSGKMGKTGCRLCFDAGLSCCTCAVKLTPNEDGSDQVDLVTGKVAESPSYKVEEIPLSSEPILHKMINPVDPTLSTTVTVWETSRPLAEPILDLPTDTELSRKAVLAKFRTCLEPCDNFASWDDFWKWAEELSDEELFRFYADMKSKLLTANGKIPTFNVHLRCLTGSHNNILLLGSADQAAGAVFYICPYMGKKKLPLKESLTVLSRAVARINEKPSTAKDVGTQS